MSLAPYYSDDHVTLLHGQALEVLRELPDRSVHSCVTSPPYFGLRDYKQAGQIGLERTPAEYVEKLRAVFVEVRRVLTDDGTLWLNLGDSYAGKANGGASVGPGAGHGRPVVIPKRINTTTVAPYKSLLGIPWRVALALVDDGWTLRNDVIWAKPNSMPESVSDRLSTRHEHFFLLAKGPRYWFDVDAIKEPTIGRASGNRRRSYSDADARARVKVGERYGGNPGSTLHDTVHEARNPGDVWTIPTYGFPDAHFAVMAPAIAERCILAGARPGGTVLDPFSGSGTTGLAALKHGRRYVGIDLSAEYLDLSLRTRFAQPGLDLTVGDAS